MSFRRELTTEDLQRMRIPQRYWDVRFDQISDTEKGSAASPRRLVRAYMEKMDEMHSRGAGLFLWGPNGMGKTSAAVVIGKEYRRRGKTVMFMSCSEIKSAIIDKTAFDGETSLWDRAKTVDVLLLDDLGKGVQDGTGFGLRALDELLRTRNAERRTTFITTNMAPGKQLESELKTSTLHSLKESIVPVKFVGPDRREAVKSELLNLLMEDSSGT
jgi:DNA replication protein DnaC